MAAVSLATFETRYGFRLAYGSFRDGKIFLGEYYIDPTRLRAEK